MSFFAVLNLSLLFASMCWLTLFLLAKIPVNLYALQKKVVLASFYLIQSELLTAKVTFKRHLNCFDCTGSSSYLFTLIRFYPFGCLLICAGPEELRSWRLQGWRRTRSGWKQGQPCIVRTMAPINILVMLHVFYLTLRCDGTGENCSLYVLQHRKSTWTFVRISRISWLVLRNI